MIVKKKSFILIKNKFKNKFNNKVKIFFIKKKSLNIKKKIKI